MNVITTTAFANLRKNKSRNILIGTAIALTAFLLTLLPTMVTGQLSLQFQAVNELYAPIHGVYRNVDGETAAEMAEDDVFETVCRREIAGKIYTGVCIDTCSTLGICAERNAIFNMVTCGEQEIKRVLAIMPDGKSGAPCGACRELMVQLMPEGYKDIEVLMDYESKRIVTLGELTPEWWI